MTCMAKENLERRHSHHYCVECVHYEKTIEEVPCDECYGLVSKCAWTPKEVKSMKKIRVKMERITECKTCKLWTAQEVLISMGDNVLAALCKKCGTANAYTLPDLIEY